MFSKSYYHCLGVALALGWLHTPATLGAENGVETSAADQLATLPGFRVEVVLKADPAKNGSFISLARDGQGRLLIGTQRGQSVTRLTLEEGKIVREEVLRLPVSEIMGQLWVPEQEAWYVDASGTNAAGRTVYGLFRLRESADDHGFEAPELLREWRGGAGEHGAHAILLGPDHRHLYIVCGNFVEQPGDVSPTSPHRHFADDLVLPRTEDGNGFGAGKKPPGGSIFRMDLEGKQIERFAAGERNTYDIAFNADGELFGFDSDMEWDWGTPWYRPIRVFHAPSGADQGFREGSAKWPEYYEDSLPAAATVGIGSPTGVIFGGGTKFPARYQKALYVEDWTYGRLIAVHLRSNGATYDGTWEDFVAPKSLHATSGKVPVNLTAIVVGADGAIYFTTGGRNTQGYLYRVTYVGDESTAPADLHDPDGAVARAIRHKLETFHGAPDPAALFFAWPYLNSEDRFLRYAARLAVEAQPLAQWQDRALSETQPQAALEASLALARLGGPDTQPSLLEALSRFPLASLTKPQQLQKLRVVEVSLARQGHPTGPVAERLVTELDALYPNTDQAVNRELCQLLLALDAPDAVAKTLQLLAQAPTQEEQVGYVLYLRTIKSGWTPALRRQYFSWFTLKHDLSQHPPGVVQWFTDAGREYGDGASYHGFMVHLFADAKKTLTPEEAKALEPILLASEPAAQTRPARRIRPHAFVKEWKMADLLPALDEVGHGRNFRRGLEAMEVAQCLACHKFGDQGGAIGPDLTAVASRFTRRDILESILEPSKVISEQYANTSFELADGDEVEGRVLEENADTIVVRPNPLQPDTVKIKKADVKTRSLSKVSPMPEGSANILSRDEMLDLLALLESGGNRNHPDFQAPNREIATTAAAKGSSR